MIRYLQVLVMAGTLLCAETKAQLLSVSPAFPTETSTITIVVDCAKGNRGLFNYGNASDVYVHVGVITNLSTSPGNWRHVKFADFNSPNAAAQATSLGNNRYQYTIANIRSFFGVPAGETILKVTFLLRNGNGTVVQRNSDGNDMYIPVFTTALAGDFFEPFMEPRYIPVAEPVTKTIGDRIRINYQTNNAATLRLFFNGTEINSTTSATTILDSPVITTAGNQQIVGRATDGVVTVSDTINFFIAPVISVQPLPAGVRDGINYEQGDTSVILVLYAPNKSRVSVIGDFNDWTQALNSQMNQTPDAQRYWIRIKGLSPGTEYAYQYVVDNNLVIADPYTQKVLDPAHDPSITATTYPNLKPYPTGKTNGIVSVLQTAEPGYAWQVTNFSKPDKRNLLIYELLVRDFVANHDWKTLKDTLGYLKRLGINAIELMPFNEFEGNLSWGYNTSFYFAPDKYYGPKNRLKELIDECHKQGIAVVMDIALNHSFGQSPMVQLYFDAANNRPATNSPWYNPVPRHAFNVGYDMNHESLATRYFVSRVTEHWLQEYRIDGFRFDLSKGFTQNATCDANGGNCNVGAWSNYDASRVAIWKRYYDTVQTKSTGAYVILEHFADDAEEIELSTYGMMLWGNLNYNFNEATMGYKDNSNFERAIHTVRGFTQPHLVSYMESHDEERLMFKNINYGNASGGYNVKDLATGLRRNEMAAAFYFTIPGPKMIWQFGELGYDYSINYCPLNGSISDACRTDAKPIKWDYWQHAGRKQLYDLYAAMLKLRNHPLYRNGFVTNRVERSLTGGFKWLKLTTDTSNILVIGNVDVVATTGSVTFQSAGTWYDYLTGETFNATGAAQSISLQPGEYHVYLNRNITGTSTPVNDLNDISTQARLTVYPNPIVKNATIEYELPASAVINISLCTLYGQRISASYTGFKAKGTHKLPLNTITAGKTGLLKGVYLLQLEWGNNRKVQKIMIE